MFSPSLGLCVRGAAVGVCGWWFEHHFPADFIVEYVAQTRGWFYTMVVLATALFDKPPFRHCMCHGVVLDQDGQKLSKRLRNYPDPELMCDTHGAAALRWFMVSSPILRGQDLQVDKDGKKIGEVVRLVVNPIWNAYSFFTLYANTDGVRGKLRTDSKQLLVARRGCGSAIEQTDHAATFTAARRVA